MLLAVGVLVAVAVACRPALENLPVAATACLVLGAAIHLIRPSQWRRYWSNDPRDLWTLAIPTVVAISLGVLPGLIVALIVSALMFIRWDAAERHRATEHDHGDRWTNWTEHLAEAAARTAPPGMLILRPDSALFAGNIAAVRTSINERAETVRPTVVLLDISRSPTLDLAVIDTLHDLADELAPRGAALWLAFLPTRDCHQFEQTTGSPIRYFDDVDSAIAAFPP